jgi:beta-glucanase (GH16 family)
LQVNSKKNWLLGLGALLLLLLLVLLFLLVLLGISSLGSPAPIPMLTPIPPTATPTGDWKLVWSDEFDGPNGSAVDTAKWSFDVGCGGWGNGELQYYTDRTANAYIEDGALVIKAQREDYSTSRHTSARLATRNKGDWLTGRFEIRAKLPCGQGIWPAIWMLPTDWEYGGWPSSGEIDIMELVGHEPARVHGTLHYGKPHTYTGNHYELTGGETFADRYHVFATEWEPGEIRWYVDGVHYQTQTEWFTSSSKGTHPAPFDRRFHLIINVAVGGAWPGYPDETTVLPQTMHVDYVRVYQK